MAPIRILLVDDQTLILDGLRTILDLEPDMTVVGVASDGESAVQKAIALRPDVILMDLKMPGMDGVECTRRVKAALPEVKIVILTIFDDDDYVFGGVTAGAQGYVMKDVSADELIQVVRAVAAGGAIISPKVAAKILREFGRLSSGQGDAPARRPPRPPLTEREWEILRHLARGATNKEIAAALFIAEGTVKNHVSNIFDKLQLRDRTKVAVYATQWGLLDEDSAERLPKAR
jgi:DNA-binding NarL/FixJ family response regulator